MSKIIISLVFVFSLSHLSCIAQSKPEKRLVKKVTSLMAQEDWYNAQQNCLQLYKQAPENPDVNFMLGVCYQKNNRVDKSLGYLLFASGKGNSYPDMDFYLGRAYQFNLKFDSAVNNFKKYLDKNSGHTANNPYVAEAQRHIEECGYGKKLVSDSLFLKIINVGPVINSPFPEYVPLVTPDQKTMIFTSRRPNTTGGKMDNTGQYMEDIYLSHADDNGQWSTPENSLPFNSREHDACVGLSVDGNTLIIYKPTNAGDLYISDYDGKKWSKPDKIKGDVNTPYWESSASITLDGRYMYFTSDKPGGYGGSDIYIAEKLDNDYWGNVRNLGPTINTRFDEDAPQIHGDNVTLFFSSRGHNTIGGYDVFSAVYNSDDSTWSKPRNIGYPVNTPGDDIYFFLVADGSRGYFSSFREDSYGEKDIYEILRPNASPAKFVMKFNLNDPYKNMPIKANIYIKDLETGDSVKMASVDAEKGEYNCVLDFEKKYALNLSADGYAFKEKEISIGYRADIFEYVMDIVPRKEEVVELVDTLDASGIIEKPAFISGSDKERVKRSIDPGIRTLNRVSDTALVRREFIYITRLSTREKIIFNPVQFSFNSHEVTGPQRKNLAMIADFLKNSPNIHIIVTGFTDNTGNVRYNEELSIKRAEAVKNLLISGGIGKSRIHVTGMGESNPIANNKSIFGRSFNRRVDLLLIDISDKKYMQGEYGRMVGSYHLPFAPEPGYHTPYVVNELLPVSVHFTMNSTHLTQYSTANLKPFTDYLKTVPFNVIIMGIADSDEENPPELVEKRAEVVSRFMTDSGIKASRIVTLTSREAGQYKNLIKNEPGIENRRVQFILIKN